jgi:hypothetical protein
VDPIELLLPCLDERQVQGDRPRQQQNPRVEAEHQEDQHGAVSLGQNRTRCKRQLPRPWNHVTTRPMTVKDVILTIAIMLGVGLVCQLVADFARIPRMLLLLFAGVLLGPSVSDAIDIPLDSMGRGFCCRSGSRSSSSGGLQLSTRVASRVAVSTLLGTSACSRRSLPVRWRRSRSAAAHLRFADRRHARPTVSVLIPLFERLGLRPKVSERSSPSPRSTIRRARCSRWRSPASSFPAARRSRNLCRTSS